MEKKLIYFDYAATTPVDSEVLEKMLPYYKENYGNADSLHIFGRKAQTAVDCARDKVAELLGAKPSEIYFTSGGTESDNWAVLGGAYACKKRGKTHILASQIEHHAVLSAMERLEKEGFEIEYIPVNAGGRVEISDVEKRLKENTGLVAVMKANNETGAIQPVEEIAKLCKERGILCFSDCVQYVPHRNLDVNALGADVVAISSHKFHGPKGCGALYIKKGVGIEKLVAGGEQERGMRGGTLNVPAVVGLAHALELCYKNNQEREKRIKSLRDKFLDKVLSLDGVTLNGDFSKDEDGLASIINLRFDGVENTSFLYNMDLNGIAVASGSACASASLKPSHVLTAMGLSESEAKSSIRFSIGKDTTEEEIEYVANKCEEILQKIRAKR
ncbi:MAG: cysteine desulfurase [Clostridia bacterium]|nr:cysteine desulfurase [Clostridia bacterium]